ncbi:hypothetical protein ACFOD0_11660 [Shewanella intestini]|uniref:Uncharacterized protein n=1 Tax=Shewanella intestini TaxID=2017544 RepID=A0ABS5I361_9GAMM|nr:MULTISPECIES: hypothetical protein [Shewanella]MBR9728439.1 hypothetical protein [Shewanella intestini]MRG36781.1 hypothetical protein [Shewanella sp. XMDDZSB0408]
MNNKLSSSLIVIATIGVLFGCSDDNNTQAAPIDVIPPVEDAGDDFLLTFAADNLIKKA